MILVKKKLIFVGKLRLFVLNNKRASKQILIMIYDQKCDFFLHFYVFERRIMYK